MRWISSKYQLDFIDFKFSIHNIHYATLYIKVKLKTEARPFLKHFFMVSGKELFFRISHFFEVNWQRVEYFYY